MMCGKLITWGIDQIQSDYFEGNGNTLDEKDGGRERR